jgi:hypothetical protein
MFSLKLVLVCDQVLIQSQNLCENGYCDNLHIEHIAIMVFMFRPGLTRLDEFCWAFYYLHLQILANSTSAIKNKILYQFA